MSRFFSSPHWSKIGAKTVFLTAFPAFLNCSLFRPALPASPHLFTGSYCKNCKENQSKMVVDSVPNKLSLKYTKVVEDAYPPTKGSPKAAGYDLKSCADIVVPARGKAMVDTGIKIELPEGCYGRIAPRSGLAAKNFIDVGAGVVDEDYRGVLKVILFNHSDTDFEVKKGDRIAQLICERIYYPDLEEVKELTDTQRGEGGFGSTGTN